ncbi:MAG: hypothetical protein A2749_01860 [Parcubacteria group bacterium RIFCSPHIGHO2_01_FULL_45_26]|nr:MAG: hypothetical protein A2749_01860 [Parcubacteria group bacterium RIFCSPHIGHO2_01_FULL_45_26]
MEESVKQTYEGDVKTARRDFLVFVLGTLAVVLPIRLFVAQPFIVQGASMVPTFNNGDYLIVDEISYRFREPQKGDVVVFRYPKDVSKFFIKRIEGTPGDMVNQTKLLNDQYFVLGDNSEASSDSRIWGPVPRKNIIGRPFVRLLPIKNSELFPGKEKTSSQEQTK